MFIRSDTITVNEIRIAIGSARMQGADIFIDPDGIREFKPRRYANGYELFCESTNGRYARNQRGGRAATWTDYGRFIANLYLLDPNAEISFYKSAKEFMQWTRKENKRMPDNYPAPWLTIPQLVAVEEDESPATNNDGLYSGDCRQ